MSLKGNNTLMSGVKIWGGRDGEKYPCHFQHGNPNYIACLF